MTDPKLSQISRDGNLVGKIDAILLGLQKHGYPDAFIAEAMRTRAEQAEKVRLGYSKTLTGSYHLKRGSDGKGMAADIVPKSTGWNAPKRYWMMLGHLCRSYGVGWGGLFGLNGKQKAKLIAAMDVLSAAGWPATHPAYQTQIGWDGAHAQKGNNW